MAEAIGAEIKQIKREMQKPNLQSAANHVEEKDIFQSGSQQSNEEASSIKLLGELLSFLRKARSMSLLMLCRQIEKIEVENNIAIIHSNDDDMMSIQTNDRFRSDISTFFESKGLGFKVKEKEVKFSEVDELQRLLGKKLKIK